MTRQELLDALTVERYDNRWWKTLEVTETPDDEITTARRRRHMAADFATVGDPRVEAS